MSVHSNAVKLATPQMLNFRGITESKTKFDSLKNNYKHMYTNTHF